MSGWVDHGGGAFSCHYPSLSLNIGAIICGEGLLVVDTRSHYGEARRLQEDLRVLSPLPVRWVVNTHHHWDHTFGNALFLPAEIWGHRRCAEAMIGRGEAMRREARIWMEGEAALIDEVAITPPDHTLVSGVAPTFGGRVVELHYFGRGHTDNDVAVVLPDAGVAFAGDLIEEGGPPYFEDSYPLEWPDAAAGLAALGIATVVPGHGAVIGPAFLRRQQEDLAQVAVLARERHAAGMTLPAAAAAGGPFPGPVLRAAFARAWPTLELGG